MSVDHFSETDLGYEQFCKELNSQYPTINTDEIPYLNLQNNKPQDTKRFITFLQKMELPAIESADEETYKGSFIIVNHGSLNIDNEIVSDFQKTEESFKAMNIVYKRIHISADDNYVLYKIARSGIEF